MASGDQDVVVDGENGVYDDDAIIEGGGDDDADAYENEGNAEEGEEDGEWREVEGDVDQ